MTCPMHYYSVYILRCSDSTYYVGVTNDVTARVSQHQLGIDPKSYTHRRRPVSLVYSAEFEDINDAIVWDPTSPRLRGATPGRENR